MWMQNSAGGASGNFHDRNRFGSQYAQSSYSGGAAHNSETGDWKSKILESGQWLGGKVIEYGGKLARGPNTNSIPDHYAPQMPRNDGRANWMADIRTSSSSYSGGGLGGYNGGYNGSGGGYQNDFATERPKSYSDYNKGYSSNPSGAGGYEPKSLSSNDHHHGKSRHAKKKNESKKSKKSKKNKKKQQSESESESVSESEELSISESSETESADERRHKSKGKAKKKSKGKKHSGFYSEESDSDSDDDKRKASADYSFSFDPAKLPPPPVKDEKETSKKSKAKKSKKEKSGKKSRTRRQSVASTDDESTSEKENTRAKAKKRGSKKAAAAVASSASVDLLGVDLDAQPVAQPTTTGLPAQEVQPSIFDAPQSQNPLQDLAGLSFTAPVQAPAPTHPSVFDGSAPATASNEIQSQPQQQADAFRTNLLPENNIVDLSSLVSDKKKTLSANPEEKRTLNDLQKARGADQPTPVMAMPMQGQQQMHQQHMPSGMMQVSMNMNQLQITDGSTGMQQQMYPNMQMQQMPMQSQMMMMQPQMGMMAQPQMMNMQMMQQQQQQFAQGGASMAQPTGAQQTQQVTMSGTSNSNSSDPFNQLP